MSFEDYHHPPTGFRMPVPTGWELIENPQQGVALVAVEPSGSLGFRANIVVTVETIPDEYDVLRWQSEVEHLLPTELGSYSLIDQEHIDGPDHQVVRRLAHHVADSSGSVTMEQWAMIVGPFGYTLTGSVATFAYDSLADMFAEIASRFHVDQDMEASS